MTSRRGFLLGLGAALAAPAIVRSESLMKIAVLRDSIVGLDVAAPASDIVTLHEIYLQGRVYWVTQNRIIQTFVGEPPVVPGLSWEGWTANG